MAHRVHLDYASTAPMRPEVRDVMTEALRSDPFDPRRLYDDAIKVRYEIETSREKVAAFLGCDSFEVIFTSSHSESLATFAYGVAAGAENCSVIGTAYDSEIISKTWARENVELKIVDGNSIAKIDIDHLAKLVDEKTVAISIPFAHPDTGTIQNIEEITSIVKRINPRCLVHLDARLAAGNCELRFSEIGVDAMSIDPITFGGPAGIACLVLSRKSHLNALLTGSTQERARRAGLENLVGIAGFGALCETAKDTLPSEIAQAKKFKSKIVNALTSAGAIFLDLDPETMNSLPHLVCAYLNGIAASAVVAEFNRAGINIHAGSSCGSEEFEPSKQLNAVTNDEAISESVFRISWGYATKVQDIDLFTDTLGSLPFQYR